MKKEKNPIDSQFYFWLTEASDYFSKAKNSTNIGMLYATMMSLRNSEGVVEMYFKELSTFARTTLRTTHRIVTEDLIPEGFVQKFPPAKTGGPIRFLMYNIPEADGVEKVIESTGRIIYSYPKTAQRPIVATTIVIGE